MAAAHVTSVDQKRKLGLHKNVPWYSYTKTTSVGYQMPI